MKFKVKETFASIQGEGILVGTPMNFIRFARCNLKCGWCDTDFHGGKYLDVKDILKKLNKKIEWVSLTGGEPMCEENLIDLIDGLEEEHYGTYLETNGSLFDSEIFSRCDFVSVDIKPPSSGNSVFDENAVEYAVKNPEKTQLKVVIHDEKDVEFFGNFYEKFGDYGNFIIQPENSVVDSLDYGKLMKKFPKARIIPQMHRILRLR